jgi:hypothetical protein
MDDFMVGDRVTVPGALGEFTIVGVHEDALWLTGEGVTIPFTVRRGKASRTPIDANAVFNSFSKWVERGRPERTGSQLVLYADGSGYIQDVTKTWSAVFSNMNEALAKIATLR